MSKKSGAVAMIIVTLMLIASVHAQNYIGISPFAQGITGIGVQTGDPQVDQSLSCVQSCVNKCIRDCRTTSCGQQCGQHCAAKCVSGAGVTTGDKWVKKPDVNAYCRQARSCGQCAQLRAYRCLWAGAGCVPCTSPSCTFSCEYIPRTQVNKQIETNKQTQVNKQIQNNKQTNTQNKNTQKKVFQKPKVINQKSTKTSATHIPFYDFEQGVFWDEFGVKQKIPKEELDKWFVEKGHSQETVVDDKGKVKSVKGSFEDLSVRVASCTDGIQNGREQGIDCGGYCNPCKVVKKVDKSTQKNTTLNSSGKEKRSKSKTGQGIVGNFFSLLRRFLFG